MWNRPIPKIGQLMFTLERVATSGDPVGMVYKRGH